MPLLTKENILEKITPCFRKRSLGDSKAIEGGYLEKNCGLTLTWPRPIAVQSPPALTGRRSI